MTFGEPQSTRVGTEYGTWFIIFSLLWTLATYQRRDIPYLLSETVVGSLLVLRAVRAVDSCFTNWWRGRKKGYGKMTRAY